MANKKRIGILTSGGDCAGLNAAIRAVVLAATAKGYEVLGIEKGMTGLTAKPPHYRILTPTDVDPTLLRAGGTFLGTINKGTVLNFDMPDADDKERKKHILESLDKLDKDSINDAKKAIEDLKLEALIGVGGDGSMSMMSYVSKKADFNFVGIPKTIDNDVAVTDTSIGFATAVNVATEALDKLHTTAASHERIMVLEVMGRDAGHIALSTGIAGGADIILLPEIPYDFNKVVEKINKIKEEENRNYVLVVVAEALKNAEGCTVHKEQEDGMRKLYGGVGSYVAETLQKLTGIEARAAILGHLQRGGSPIPYDRMIATAFGAHAVELAISGKFDRMVAWSGKKVIDIPIEDAIATYQDVDVNGSLVRTARSIGICLGD